MPTNPKVEPALLEQALMNSGERMLSFFRFEHLPNNLQAISVQFAFLAVHLVDNLVASPERTVALRKLLESKDCAVRAAL